MSRRFRSACGSSRGFRGRGQRLARCGALSIALLCWLPASRALAIDGVVDIRTTSQEGRAGADKYTQRSTTSQLRANQHVSFMRHFGLRFDGGLTRETFRSRFGLTRSDFNKRTGTGGLSLDLTGRGGRLMLDGQTFDQKTDGNETDSPSLRRNQLNGAAQFRHDWIELGSGGSFISSRRVSESAGAQRNEEWTGTISSRLKIPKLGEARYKFASLTGRDLNLHTRVDQTTHTVNFSSATRFAGGRGYISTKETSSFFTQTQTRPAAGSGMRLMLPDAGGYLLDDTPDLHDPLEMDLVSVPELYDGNRQTSTDVQIGDSAPAVRQFGGDYRNIVFDFGDAADVESITIYIDKTLPVPGMIQWRVFTSNDPDGRIWEESTSAQFAYAEWGVGLQGWTATFPQDAAARFIKVVDVKLGPTVADLSMTELEVFSRGEDAKRERSETVNHRLGLSMEYKLTPGLRAGYDLTYRRRTLTGGIGALQSQGHGLTASWTKSIWSVSGRHEIRRTDGQRSRDANVNAQSLTVKRGRDGALVSTLSWSRVDDRSGENDKLSNSISLGYSLPAAPSLRIDQRITTGRLLDYAADRTSTSLTAVTSITGAPVPSITLDLQQSERWVSQEAGTGFSRFDDTSLTLGWRPVPLIVLQSAIRYQLRDRGDWLVQSSATWEPLSEGTLSMGLSANHLRDTRANETQRGGGVHLEWRLRPNLTLQGNLEAVGLKKANQHDSPLNTDLRGILRF